MRNLNKTGWLLLAIIFLAVPGQAFAESSEIIVVQSNEIVPHDKFVGGQIIKNEGTIKGDLIFWGQSISSDGTIEGDAIGVGQNVHLAGNVLGNVRTGGSTVNLSSQIGKNVNVFGGVITLAESSVVNGSLIALGGKINLNGKIKGRTLIGGGKILLNGEFFGDVDINDFGISESAFDDHNLKAELARPVRKRLTRHRPAFDDYNLKAKLTVLPGTVIHGKLKFRGANAEIQQGAKVADFQWIKSSTTARERQKRDIYQYARKFVRLLFTTAVYFLIGLLLFKLFPAFFRKTAELTDQKPWNAIGYGSVAIFSTIAAAIACIILFILSLFMSPAFGFIFGITATAFYVLLFYLATIPVALWLGGLILKKKPLAYRFGIGLAVYSLGLFVLVVLGKLFAIGPVFQALTLVARFGAVLLGAGALLYAIGEVYLPGKKGESR